jgi:hypothetical protein
VTTPAEVSKTTVANAKARRSFISLLKCCAGMRGGFDQVGIAEGGRRSRIKIETL